MFATMFKDVPDDALIGTIQAYAQAEEAASARRLAAVAELMLRGCRDGEHAHWCCDAAQPDVIDEAAAASSAETVSVEAVPEAVVTSERVEFERKDSGTAEQREAALTTRFRIYLEARSREVKRYKITTPVGVFFTDTADVTAGVLYEAKGNAERMSVRLALGQVLDYGRFVSGAQLAVLLPSAPAADLVELLESHSIGCVVESNPGQFADMTGLGRCP